MSLLSQGFLWWIMNYLFNIYVFDIFPFRHFSFRHFSFRHFSFRHFSLLSFRHFSFSIFFLSTFLLPPDEMSHYYFYSFSFFLNRCHSCLFPSVHHCCMTRRIECCYWYFASHLIEFYAFSNLDFSFSCQIVWLLIRLILHYHSGVGFVVLSIFL